MKLSEFNALVTGDQVENAMTNGKGTVSKVHDRRPGDRVVSVQWGAGTGPEFSYATQSTAWFHWSKVDNSLTKPDDMGLPS